MAHKVPGGGFRNPFDTWEERGFVDAMRWQFNRRRQGLPGAGKGWLSWCAAPTPADWAAAFPTEPPAASLHSPPADAVQATWIGHSTVLVQLEGQTLLTDPIFASRASPLSFAGPKRVVPPALTVAELPDDLSGVLISHNHYDHLCLSSVRELHARYGSQLRWYVPLGVAAWFTKTLGITAPHVAELDWWEEAEHAPGVRVVLTPAQHWSTRGLFDRFATLWGSWAVLGTSLRFFFTGDTGYSQIFTQIGERLGPFDLAAIPTGAYEPRNFMKPQHVNPEEAVQLHIELQSRRSMAIHLGTFALTDESMDEPVTLLVKEAADAGLASDEFITLRHGATLATAAGKDVFAPARLAFPSAAASSAPKID